MDTKKIEELIKKLDEFIEAVERGDHPPISPDNFDDDCAMCGG